MIQQSGIQPNRSPLRDARARTVMIVDDDDDIREVIHDVLRDEGCTVYQERGGIEALATLRTVVPDLIIFDLMMPVMNGWTFYAELQQDPVLSQIPVVVLSAASHLLPDGCVTQLRKPIDLTTLLQLLDTIDAPQSARKLFARPNQM